MRILIVDDNQLIRRGVRDILSSGTDWEVCGEASNGADALVLARDLRPDTVIVDISMPGLGGLEAARILRDEFPKINVLIMSQNDSAQLLAAAQQSGAQGCVDKSRLSSDLLPAVRLLLSEPKTYKATIG
jgi:DNA-binding NarL/FixJ family response regulator